MGQHASVAFTAPPYVTDAGALVEAWDEARGTQIQLQQRQLQQQQVQVRRAPQNGGIASPCKDGTGRDDTKGCDRLMHTLTLSTFSAPP